MGLSARTKVLIISLVDAGLLGVFASLAEHGHWYPLLLLAMFNAILAMCLLAEVAEEAERQQRYYKR